LRKQQFSTRQATAQGPPLPPEQLPGQRQAFASSVEAFRAPSQNSPANMILNHEKQVSPFSDSQYPGPEPDRCCESQPFASNSLISQIGVPDQFCELVYEF
jgi:hypothetical protein